MVSSAERLRVLSLIPWRVRFHLPGWTAGDAAQVETRLVRVRGVRSVQANPLTGNVLIRFDPRKTDGKTLLAEFQEAWDGMLARRRRSPAGEGVRRSVQGQGPSASPWLRVGVRGLLGHAAVDSLWFGAGFLGEAFGLPLAGLGPLHLLMDITVWGMALA